MELFNLIETKEYYNLFYLKNQVKLKKKSFNFQTCVRFRNTPRRTLVNKKYANLRSLEENNFRIATKS
jgi:hypothetical protein